MKKLQLRITVLLVLSAFFVTGAFGNTITFDTSFNGTGYSINAATSPPQGSLGDAIAIQPDGKIVIGGLTNGNAQDDVFAVMRLNADGTLDTSFGNGGSMTTGVGTDHGGVDMLLQPDGKILMCGFSYAQGTDSNFLIVRYTSGGVLDTTFNSTGYNAVNISGSSADICSSMVLQPDGKIIMVGSTAANGASQNDVTLVRLNTDGTLDSTFNGTGMVIVANPNFDDWGATALRLADGKLLVGGFRHDSVKYNYLLMRFSSDGTIDTSFGTGGSTVTSVSSGQNMLTMMALQSDGKIVAGGSDFLVRYTANGILDTSFAINGVANLSATLSDMYEIVVTGDDKIVIASRFGANGGAVRYLANGFPDTNFNGGAANVHVPGGTCVTYSVAIQSDNKIVLGGSCNVGNTISKFAAYRLQETRTKRFLDFNGDGGTDISIFRPSNGQWWYSSGQFGSPLVAAQWGTASDLPVPADFTGDGRTDVAVWRPSTGEWFILRSENNTFYAFPFGTDGDIPIPADYDGDDRADHGVFRSSTGEWYIQKSTGDLLITTFGTSGDRPVPSDYDGDFKTDIAIYRPSAGEWWIQRSTDDGVYAFQFGSSADKPVQGDYTGDNKTDAAFWRPSTGEWFVLRSEDYSYFSVPFGLNGDLPTPGNYAGDGRFDFVIYRPSETQWHVLPTGGTYFRKFFGSAGDQPLANLFVP